MNSGVVLTILVLFLVVLSVRERMRVHRYREKDWSIIGESKSSPLSQALTNLIGVAGGIYLSLEVMTIFINLQLPERIHLAGVSLEPLSAISILLAVSQPYLQRAVHAWRRI